MNYILLLDFGGLDAGEVFLPTAEPTIYSSSSNTDFLMLLATMQALPDYFLQAVSFNAQDKLAGIEKAMVDSVTWTPAVGDYYSDYNQELDLYKITGIVGDEFSVLKINGNLTGITNPFLEAISGFETDRYQVLHPSPSSSSSSL